MRTVLAVALLVLVVSAGCIGTPRVSEEPPDWVTTDAGSATTETPTTSTAPDTPTATETPTETTDGLTTTDAPLTTDTPPTTDTEPRKGDQFLSVSQLNESRAMRWNASKRATFGNLSEERQQVVKAAVECDCNVELDGEFSFHDEERVEVVEYDGTYYFLRVSIV